MPDTKTGRERKGRNKRRQLEQHLTQRELTAAPEPPAPSGGDASDTAFLAKTDDVDFLAETDDVDLHSDTDNTADLLTEGAAREHLAIADSDGERPLAVGSVIDEPEW